jgi:metal-dependent hydrolase (beta-lactamase superfamily II)
MLTHHHFDHVMGVSAYESEGATLIAAAAHEKVARRAAEDGDSLDIKLVEDRMTIEGENRTVEIRSRSSTSGRQPTPSTCWSPICRKRAYFSRQITSHCREWARFRLQ